MMKIQPQVMSADVLLNSFTNCSPTALGRLQPFVTGRNRPKADSDIKTNLSPFRSLFGKKMAEVVGYN